MPRLLLPPPPVLSVADLVFDARKARWEVEQPLSGLPDLRWRGQPGQALYGEATAVFQWAQTLLITLLAPTPEWVSGLPEPYQRGATEAPWGLIVRHFVAEGQIRAATAWGRGDDRLNYADCRAVPEEELAGAAAFVTALLTDPAVTAPPAFVLDVGRVEGRGWAVRAALPAWCAPKGYCPPRGVLEVLRRACRGRTELRDQDWPWIVSRFAMLDLPP